MALPCGLSLQWVSIFSCSFTENGGFSFFLRLKTLRTKTIFSWFPCFVNTGAICKVAGMKSNRCSEGLLVVKRKPLFEYRLLEDQDAFDIL